MALQANSREAAHRSGALRGVVAPLGWVTGARAPAQLYESARWRARGGGYLPHYSVANAEMLNTAMAKVQQPYTFIS